MDAIATQLGRTRSLTALLMAFACLMSASTVLGDSIFGRICRIGAIWIGVLFVLVAIVGFKKTVSTVRQLLIRTLKRSGRVENVLSTVREVVRKLERSSESCCDGCRASKADLPSATFTPDEHPKSFFDQGAIVASGVISPNTQGAVGRAAAEMRLSNDLNLNLSKLLNSDGENWARRVSTVAFESLNELLATAGEITPICPNRAKEMLEREPHVVIIDERCFYQGPWSGTLLTHRTTTFLELTSALAAARSRGAEVILIESDAVCSLTNSLREVVDRVIAPGGNSGEAALGGSGNKIVDMINRWIHEEDLDEH